MQGFLLQDWISATAFSGQTMGIVQAESDWFDAEGFQDLVPLVEVRSVILPAGSTNVELAYQTAPARDNELFMSMPTTATTVPLWDAANGRPITPTITPVILAANPNVPLSRWVRWILSLNGTPTNASDWGANFRVFLSANACWRR